MTYNVWDGHDKFINMDEWQIRRSLEDVPPIGYEVHLDNQSWQ